jgi:cysteine synthase
MSIQAYLGNLHPTPLVPISVSGSPRIWAKLEFLNASGSTKDRIARFILEKAMRQGLLVQGQHVAEASSGSTSIAMALVCAQLGLRFTAVMPEGVSNERGLMIRAYGGELRYTPKAEGIRGAIAETERMAAEGQVFLPQQFTNPDNALAHRIGSAREILNQVPGGSVAAVVSGVGTGGTLVGLYQGMLDAGCRAIPVLAKPVTFEMISDVECCSFSARIPGVVDNLSTIFREEDMPGLEAISVSDTEALEVARELMKQGFPVGPSSGLNFRAAWMAAEKLGIAGPIVTVFPDRMERYFTTEMFAPYR